MVFHDHATGEIADYVCLWEDGQDIVVELYHCKSSSEEKPGHRVKDVYDVTLLMERLDPASSEGLTACDILLLPINDGESEANVLR